jgi:hypothetical protein
MKDVLLVRTLEENETNKTHIQPYTFTHTYTHTHTLTHTLHTLHTLALTTHIQSLTHSHTHTLTLSQGVEISMSVRL